MKREVKPFVVEVKRGKRRQSFLGQPDEETSTMSEATRRAELALFAGPGDAQSKAASNEPAGRILPSLIEPPPPEVPIEEEPQPRRRGRKPGSKNKPKTPAVLLAEPTLPETFASTPQASQPRGDAIETTLPETPVDPPVAEARHEVSGRQPRIRLRDRSRILARYVHGTQPTPGERWSSKRRRARRAG